MKSRTLQLLLLSSVLLICVTNSYANHTRKKSKQDLWNTYSWTSNRADVNRNSLKASFTPTTRVSVNRREVYDISVENSKAITNSLSSDRLIDNRYLKASSGNTLLVNHYNSQYNTSRVYRAGLIGNNSISNVIMESNRASEDAKVSCKAYKTAGHTTDGIYLIDPDGEGGIEPFEVWCDMTSTNLDSNVESSNIALKSCTQHLALYPSNAGKDAIYLIDPDGVNEGEAPFKIWCDMTTDGGGWIDVYRTFKEVDNSLEYRKKFFRDESLSSNPVIDNVNNDGFYFTYNDIPKYSPIYLDPSISVPDAKEIKMDWIMQGSNNTTWDRCNTNYWVSLSGPGYYGGDTEYQVPCISGKSCVGGSSTEGNDDPVSATYYSDDIPDNALYYWAGWAEDGSSTMDCTQSPDIPIAIPALKFKQLLIRSSVKVNYKPEISCNAHKLNGRTMSGIYLIDPDGEGGIDPFETWCDMTSANFESTSESSNTALKSCMQHLIYYPENYSKNGIYLLDPDGISGGTQPFKAYCDMTTDGGGWTLFTNIVDGVFNYVDVISVQLSTGILNNNFIGKKPGNTVARMLVEGNGSSPFKFDIVQDTRTDSYTPSTNSESEIFESGFTTILSQTNTQLSLSSKPLNFETTKTGYNGGSFVRIEGAKGTNIDGTVISDFVWVVHQQTSGGFNCKNTLNIGTRFESNNSCTGKVATKIQLFYRENASMYYSPEKSCFDHKSKGRTENGIYKIDPDGEEGAIEPFETYCDMTSADFESTSVSSNSALKSCMQHLIYYPDNFQKDGVYLLDPDGISGDIQPFKTHCDMTKDGGGWTRIDHDIARNKLSVDITPVDDCGVKEFDSEDRYRTQDGSGSHAFWYDINIPFGFIQFYLDSYKAKAFSPSGYKSDIFVSEFKISNWNTLFLSGSYGDIAFGSPDQDPVTSFSNAGNDVNCQSCEVQFNSNNNIFNLNSVSDKFRIGWGESGGEYEGWYPWYSGYIYVRESAAEYVGAEKSCRHHYLKNRKLNGVYKIDPDGEEGVIEPFETYCDMTSADFESASVSSNSALKSCMQHLMYYPENYGKNGMYLLDPDGISGDIQPFKTWCDMTKAGGGWTRIDHDIARNKLKVDITALVAAPVQEYDSENRYRTQDRAGAQAYWYDINITFGYNQFYLDNLTAKAFAVSPDVSDIQTEEFNITNWNTLYSSEGYADIAFGSPDQLPLTSFAGAGAYIKCTSCEGVFPLSDQIFTLNGLSNKFRIAWGEEGGEHEGWYPWYAGYIYVREPFGEYVGAEKSCQHHYLNNRKVDGVYKIDPDGEGSIGEFETYCDMTTDDGGWTLVHKNDRGANQANDKTDAGYNMPGLKSPDIDGTAILPREVIEQLGNEFRLITDSENHKAYWRFSSQNDVFYNTRPEVTDNDIACEMKVVSYDNEWKTAKLIKTNNTDATHVRVQDSEEMHFLVRRDCCGSFGSFWFNNGIWWDDNRPDKGSYHSGMVWVRDNTLSVPEISYFNVNKNRIERGEEIELSWSVPDGVTAELYSHNDSNYYTPKDVSSSNSKTLIPDSDNTFITYKLRITDSNGRTDEQEITVFMCSDIPYSLRFNYSESTYLKRENEKKGNKRIWTYSTWIKLGKLDVEGTGYRTLFASGKKGEPGEGSAYLYINKAGNLCFNASNDHSNVHADYISTETIESISEWTHIFVRFNSTEAQESNRFNAYVNGVELNLTSTQPVAENMELMVNSADHTHTIGAFYRNCTSGLCANENNAVLDTGGNDNYYPHLYDGYMTEIYFIDGITASVNDFGEFRDSRWIPKSTSVSDYGVNGFYLNFYDQTNPGKDYSGRNNHWKLVNYEDRKDGNRYIDQMLDSPDRNFAVVNIKDPSDRMWFHNGNLGVNMGDPWYATYQSQCPQRKGIGRCGYGTGAASTYTMSDGDWYWETVITYHFGYHNCSSIHVGFMDAAYEAKDFNPSENTQVQSYSYYYLGETFHNGTRGGYGVEINKDDVVGSALKLSSNQAYYSNSGVWLESSDGSFENADPAFENLTLTYKAATTNGSSTDLQYFHLNFGQGGQAGHRDYVWDREAKTWSEALNGEIPDARFAHIPPAGFRPLAEHFFIPQIKFTSDKYRAKRGSTITLNWDIENVTDVTASSDDPGNTFTGAISAEGTQQITLPDTEGIYSYTITANNGAGEIVTKKVTVVVTDNYEINYSLRFNSDILSHLLKTDFTSPANQNKWTYSSWVKRGSLNAKMMLLGVATGVAGTMRIQIDANGKIKLYDGSINLGVNTVNGVITDVSKWYHIVVTYDSGSSDKVKFYINGVLESDDGGLFPPDGYNNPLGSAGYNSIGALYSTSGALLNTSTEKTDGYISEMRFIDGQTLTPSVFGEFRNNEWMPRAYTGLYGTAGFYLNFSDQTSPGKDYSGNNNNWTLKNYDGRKDGDKYIDQMLDSPTRNFAVLNYNDKSSSVTLKKGNLEFSGPQYHSARATFKIADSKWYMEAKKDQYALGLSNKNKSLTTTLSSGTDASGYWTLGSIVGFGIDAQINGLPAYTANDVVSMSVNVSDRELFYYKNSSKVYSTAVTLEDNTDYYPITCSGNGELNFGQGGQEGLIDYVWNGGTKTWIEATEEQVPDARFVYAPPTGFRPLSEDFFLPQIEFTSNRYRAKRGSNIKLNWDIDYAINVTASSDDPSNPFTGTLDTKGSLQITLPDTEGEYTYTIKANNNVGDVVTKTVTIVTTDSYKINYSLRLNSSEQQFLRRVPTAESNRKVYTLSLWVKRGKTDIGKQTIFSCNETDDSTDETNIFIEDVSNASIRTQYNGFSNKYYQNNDDIDKWQHVVWVTDLNAASGSRVSVYIDGVKLTEKSGSDIAPSINTNMNNVGQPQTIGKDSRKNNGYFDGYISEMIFVDGEALTQDNFGEFKDGKWIPKQPEISDYGANGFYLNFSDQTNPGKDFSGKGNDWTMESTWTKDGDKYIDQMLDSPTRNFATVDIGASRDTYEISNGNLQAYSPGSGTGNATAIATLVLNNKSYWEVKSYQTNNCNVGVEIKGTDLQRNYSSANGYQFYNGYKRDSDKNASSYGDIVNTGDYVGVAFDINTYMIWFAKLNQWQAGGDPENVTGSAFGGITTNNYLPSFADMGASSEVGFNINFGQGGQSGLKDYKINIETGVWTEVTDGSVSDARFIYAPPTGFYPLNTAFVSPDISSFTADPTEVSSGSTTDLTWSVNGSVKEELWLDGEKVADITGQSPYTITPPEEPGEYTYTLKTYSSAGLISTKEVKITVTPGVSVESVQINDNNAEYRSNQRLEAVHTGLNPTDGNLIYNWFVDRGSGSNTIADVIIPFDGNTVNDKSGNNNNGALHDDESDGYNSNGKYGVGYEFDGVNDYIEMPTIGNLFNSDFSYSIWVYIPSEPRTEDVSFFNVRNFDDIGTGDHRAGHIVLQPDDNIRFECKGDGDNVFLEKTKNFSITKDVYLHFVVSKRGNEFRFYYNGEEQPDMRITTSGSTAIDDNNISIGRLNSNTVTEYFKGRVDELMIFDRALSSGQIKSVYDNGMRYIVPSETRVTDKWQVKVIPSNGTNTGEEKQSQQITITASRRRLIVVETQ